MCSKAEAGGEVIGWQQLWLGLRLNCVHWERVPSCLDGMFLKGQVSLYHGSWCPSK